MHGPSWACQGQSASRGLAPPGGTFAVRHGPGCEGGGARIVEADQRRATLVHAPRVRWDFCQAQKSPALALLASLAMVKLATGPCLPCREGRAGRTVGKQGFPPRWLAMHWKPRVSQCMAGPWSTCGHTSQVSRATGTGEGPRAVPGQAVDLPHRGGVPPVLVLGAPLAGRVPKKRNRPLYPLGALAS